MLPLNHESKLNKLNQVLNQEDTFICLKGFLRRKERIKNHFATFN